jgi:hypothetical protein
MSLYNYYREILKHVNSPLEIIDINNLYKDYKEKEDKFNKLILELERCKIEKEESAKKLHIIGNKMSKEFESCLKALEIAKGYKLFNNDKSIDEYINSNNMIKLLVKFDFINKLIDNPHLVNFIKNDVINILKNDYNIIIDLDKIEILKQNDIYIISIFDQKVIAKMENTPIFINKMMLNKRYNTLINIIEPDINRIKKAFDEISRKSKIIDDNINIINNIEIHMKDLINNKLNYDNIYPEIINKNNINSTGLEYIDTTKMMDSIDNINELMKTYKRFEEGLIVRFKVINNIVNINQLIISLKSNICEILKIEYDINIDKSKIIIIKQYCSYIVSITDINIIKDIKKINVKMISLIIQKSNLYTEFIEVYDTTNKNLSKIDEITIKNLELPLTSNNSIEIDQIKMIYISNILKNLIGHCNIQFKTIIEDDIINLKNVSKEIEKLGFSYNMTVNKKLINDDDNYLYILTDPNLKMSNEYKIGKHNGNVSKLQKRYITAIPRLEIISFIKCKSNSCLEKNIKNKYQDLRILNTNGNKSEIYKLDKNKLEELQKYALDWIANYDKL